MGLKNNLTKWAVSKYLSNTINKARKGNSSMLKLLDGQKRLIVVLMFIASGFVTWLTGHDISAWINIILNSLGWNNQDFIAACQSLATQILPILFALWAAIDAGWKLYKQKKAGATATELGSPVGVVKAAVADGTLTLLTPTRTPAQEIRTPAVLKIEAVKIPIVAD